jgi:ABC-type multidrug transport system fused ATPase/permease subunit
MVGSTYPLLDAFWTMLWFFAFVLWIWLLIFIFMDIFRSHDIGGFAKALWVIFVIVLPLLGVLVYLIARGGTMHERSMRQAQEQERQFQAYVRQAAGSGGTADELAKLNDLKSKGVLSDQEYEQAKAKILG